MPRARLIADDGRSGEWRSQALRRYQRLTRKAGALSAAVYLAGSNTRRVGRALFGLFEGAVSKDVVSRAWRKVKTDWAAWCARSPVDEDIVRRSPSPSNPWRAMAHPRWHGGEDADRPQGERDLGARGHRRAPGRAEGPARDQE